jgi:hypothetical protein
MTPSGYSGTPLIQKLGIKPGMKILLLNAPDNYFTLLENDITKQVIKNKVIADFIHLFAKDNRSFEKGMQTVLQHCKNNTAVCIWVSWYKKSAGIATDLTEDVIRRFALQNNLVDIKVCAVTEVWSGLKLMVPLAKRK